MYDFQRMGRAVAEIEQYIQEIRRYQITSLQVLKSDSKTRHAAAMLIFAILNRISDIGEEIMIKEQLGMPNQYTDILPSLAKANVINNELAESLNKMMKKRNVIAHFYGDILPGDLFLLINQLPSAEQFLKTVKKHIQLKEEHNEKK